MMNLGDMYNVDVKKHLYDLSYIATLDDRYPF